MMISFLKFPDSAQISIHLTQEVDADQDLNPFRAITVVTFLQSLIMTQY